MSRLTVAIKVFLIAVFLAIAALGALLLVTTPAEGESVWYRDQLKNYHLRALRTERVEIVDAEGNVRMVLDVHGGVPVIVLYDETGQPSGEAVIDNLGMAMGAR